MGEPILVLAGVNGISTPRKFTCARIRGHPFDIRCVGHFDPAVGRRSVCRRRRLRERDRSVPRAGLLVSSIISYRYPTAAVSGFACALVSRHICDILIRM